MWIPLIGVRMVSIPGGQVGVGASESKQNKEGMYMVGVERSLGGKCQNLNGRKMAGVRRKYKINLNIKCQKVCI